MADRPLGPIAMSITGRDGSTDRPQGARRAQVDQDPRPKQGDERWTRVRSLAEDSLLTSHVSAFECPPIPKNCVFNVKRTRMLRHFESKTMMVLHCRSIYPR